MTSAKIKRHLATITNFISHIENNKELSPSEKVKKMRDCTELLNNAIPTLSKSYPLSAEQTKNFDDLRDRFRILGGIVDESVTVKTTPVKPTIDTGNSTRGRPGVGDETVKPSDYDKVDVNNEFALINAIREITPQLTRDLEILSDGFYNLTEDTYEDFIKDAEIKAKALKWLLAQKLLTQVPIENRAPYVKEAIEKASLVLQSFDTDWDRYKNQVKEKFDIVKKQQEEDPSAIYFEPLTLQGNTPLRVHVGATEASNSTPRVGNDETPFIKAIKQVIDNLNKASMSLSADYDPTLIESYRSAIDLGDEQRLVLQGLYDNNVKESQNMTEKLSECVNKAFEDFFTAKELNRERLIAIQKQDNSRVTPDRPGRFAYTVKDALGDNLKPWLDSQIPTNTTSRIPEDLVNWKRELRDAIKALQIIGNTLEQRKNVPAYKAVYDLSEPLQTALSNALTAFDEVMDPMYKVGCFDRPEIKAALRTCITSCREAITNETVTEFNKHRGTFFNLPSWLRQFVGVLITGLVIPGLVIAPFLKNSYKDTFFSEKGPQTRSGQGLSKFELELNNLDRALFSGDDGSLKQSIDNPTP